MLVNQFLVFQPDGTLATGEANNATQSTAKENERDKNQTEKKRGKLNRRMENNDKNGKI